MSDAQKNGAWYGQYRDEAGTNWDWVCQRPPDDKSSSKEEELTAAYPVESNIFMLITYQTAWFWILGLPFYLILAPISQTWWTIELIVVMFSGGSFNEILKLIWINTVVFWSYLFNMILMIVPIANFAVPVLGTIVYIYVAF